MGNIYLIKNTINNKIYVGQTMRPVEERFKEHLRKSDSIDTHLYRAMRKYGKENFYYEVIEDNLPYSTLLIQEQYWIEHYDSYNNGYNETVGGEGYLKYTDEQILSLWNKGLNCTQIANTLKSDCGHISKRLTTLGVSHADKINRIQEENFKREYDPVLQLTKDGQLIKEWNTATEIERETGMLRSNIKSCCNGKLKTAYGFVWKRKNKEGPQRPNKQENNVN